MKKILIKYYKDSIKRIKSINQTETIIIATILVLLIILVRFIKIQKKYINVRVRVDSENWIQNENGVQRMYSPIWYGNQITEGLIEKNSGRKTIVDIKKVEKTTNSTGLYEIYVEAQLLSEYNKSTKQYTFKDRPLSIGDKIEMRPGDRIIKGVVVGINNNLDVKSDYKKMISLSLEQHIPMISVDKIKAGNKYYDESGGLIAEITNVKIFESTVRDYVVLYDINLNTNYNEISNNYYYNNKELSINSFIEIKLGDITVKGDILDMNIDRSKYIPKEIIISGQWYDVEQWQINSVTKGLKVYEEISKQPVAEILSYYIGQRPVKYLSQGDGSPITIYDPNFRKELFMKIKLTGYEHNGKLFFGSRQRVMVGDGIQLRTGKITCYVTVQKIESVNDIKDSN